MPIPEVLISGAHGVFVNCASVYKDEFSQMFFFFYFLSIVYIFTLIIEYNTS